MCLIPTYTEIEKLNQVKKVLHILTLPVDTEEAKKNLLYNVSYMNDMVVKGYMKERTDMDGLIYETKDKALRKIARIMPERTFDDGYVIYIYAGGRQYSYHYRGLSFVVEYKLCTWRGWMTCEEFYATKLGLWTELRRILCGDDVKCHRRIEWNGIEGSWKMTDKEYKDAITSRRESARNKEIQETEWKRDYDRSIKLATLRQIKATREENRRIKNQKAALTRWWKKLERCLSPRQKKTVAFTTRDAKKCYELYGKQAGMERAPHVRCYYSYPCPYVSESGLCQGYQYLNGHTIYDSDIKKCYDTIKKISPKYKI